MSRPVLIFLLWLFFLPLSAQDKIAFELQSGYNTQTGGDYDFVLKEKEDVVFNWSYFVMDIFGSTSKMSGVIEVFISQDSVLDVNDLQILKRSFSDKEDKYASEKIKNSFAPGSGYILGRIISTDSIKFAPSSNVLIQSILVPKITIEATRGTISDYQISDYDRKMELNLEIKLNIECCWEDLGDFNLSADVYFGNSANRFKSSDYLNGFYKTVKITENSNTISLKTELYSALNWKDGQFLIVNLSGYFEKLYFDLEEIVISTPLEVIDDISEINSTRAKDYPFLTYGNFKTEQADLEYLSIDTLLDHSRQFYKSMADGINFLEKREYGAALASLDSAFALAGYNEISTLLYLSDGVLSSAYSAMLSILDSTDAFVEPFSHEAISFRLGEAMDMENIIKKSYKELAGQLLPTELDIVSSTEDAGYFDDSTEFYNPIITQNPIFWKDITLPTLQHFIRAPDLEVADQIIDNVNTYIDLLDPLIEAIRSSDTGDYYEDIGDYLVDYNEVLDYYKTALSFYRITGNFEKGLQTYNQLFKSFEITSKTYPIEYWLEAGRFFEEFIQFQKSDSLYRLADEALSSYARGSKKPHIKARWKLKASNADVLDVKNGKSKISEKTMNKYIDQVRIMRDDAFILDYLEVMNDHSNAQKLGMFKLGSYPSMYKYNIDRLENQGQFLQTTEWYKDLGYFFGRDKQYKTAFTIYDNYFPLEEIKLRAYRASFSEESQLFYTKKVLEILSRSVNTLLTAKDSLSRDEFDNEAKSAFNRTMRLHSFILRGNYRLLYSILNSEEEYIATQFEVWKAFRLLLNEAYLRDDVAVKEINSIRKEIERTEENLLRNLQDSTALFGMGVPDYDAIREKLKEGEVAIEILRTIENQNIYYGDEVKYVAFVLSKEWDAPKLVPFPTAGKDLEGRFIRYYRSAIKFQIQDTVSWKHFWEPIALELPTNTKRIWIAPDGVFHLINPATLYNYTSEKYLIEETELRLLPTLTVLEEKEKIEISTASLFGFPAFVDNPSKDEIPHRSLDRSSLLNEEINSLPGTLDEVNKITDVLRSNDIKTKLFKGEEVTKNNIHSNADSDLLHLATHGYWIGENETNSYNSYFESLSQSGLIMAGAQTRSNNGLKLNPKGLLTAAEIQDMYLFGTKLVVLSACETGLGEVVPGEGIFGLKRAFQKAGAENLITSLWKVDDEATQKFMTSFYRELTEKNDLEMAFRNAQMGLMLKYPGVHYWGAFTLTRFR